MSDSGLSQPFVHNDEAALHRENEVLSLAASATGKARSMALGDVKASTIMPILQAHIARKACILTNEAGKYVRVNTVFKGGRKFDAAFGRARTGDAKTRPRTKPRAGKRAKPG